MREFDGGNLLQIGMPMGGIGAGCICLNGYGGIQDYSIRNRPATSAAADHWNPTDAAFALLHVREEKPITKLIEGPLPVEKIYAQGLKAQGFREGGFEGLPRFESCRFRAEYPFGHVDFSDPQIPLAVSVTGFNPFVPLDDIASGIPCAILQYQFKNPTQQAVAFDFSYHVSHLATGTGGHDRSRTTILPKFGAWFSNTDAPTAENFGSMAMGVIGHEPKIKGWFRGGWFDSISAIWQNACRGIFVENKGNPDHDATGRNGASVQVACRLEAGQSITIPVVICWYFPNVHYEQGVAESKPMTLGAPPKWRPFYAGKWADAGDVAGYVAKNYSSLLSRTRAFVDALNSSTLPPEVLDAVSSNLAILKSPTVLRQENGNVWAWEGCFVNAGCCHGTCTHVWNYAQAMPHLFPGLERTLREQELIRSMDERGHVNFRAALPDGPTGHGYHAASDGQLGGIMKVYRDWQISGNQQWLAEMYPLARRSLEYCIATWDPDRRGALFEPHHNTYDIEFWGPDGMCTSVYLGALVAASQMAKELGKNEDARTYETLAARSATFMDETLFNGEYYQQNVEWKTLRDQSFAAKISDPDQNDEMIQLLRAEGPKYQYGTGCISDGVIGVWMATLYGIELPLNTEHVRSHLSAVFKHNFKTDLSQHACLQRPGYALGHEPGLLLCTWPRGDMLTLRFPYSDEAWTGIEYQVASHLIMMGQVEEGLTIVRAVRSRYEGHVRNPFNEYECGSYYARALASYALLGVLSGFRYSAATRILHFGPAVSKRPFRVFFCGAEGFGTIVLNENSLSVEMMEGRLQIKRLELTVDSGTRIIDWQVTATPGSVTRITV